MAKSLHCQVGGSREAVSSITGRVLLVNVSSDKFLVVEPKGFQDLPGLVSAFEAWLTGDGTRSHKLAREVIAAVRSFALGLGVRIQWASKNENRPGRISRRIPHSHPESARSLSHAHATAM